MKLWQKHWELDKLVEAFETKGDLLLDGHLVRADVIGSLAQAAGLNRIGILSDAELQALRRGLTRILMLWKQEKFTLKAGDEDVHTKIETWLTQEVGDVGKKIHTGRSRNDQVATAIRIYTKEQLHDIVTALLALIAQFVAFARTHEKLPMPGYTHMQRAMPSSVGLWAGAFAEGLLDSLGTLEAAYALNDQSPLGSAAGYGVPLPHDRAYTAKLMGFAKVQNNSLSCQNGRGVIEASVVAALISILQHLSKFASDVLLFTTKEFDMFMVADELCSGSSIMPQKRNIDLAELIRSKTHVLTGHYVTLVGISANLISGYNRDLQDTKKPLLESLGTAHDTIVASLQLLRGLAPRPVRLREMMTSEIYSTHHALAQVTRGISFRDAYAGVSKNVADGKKKQGFDTRVLREQKGDDAQPVGYVSALEDNREVRILEQSTHEGGTGNVGLGPLAREIKGRQRHWQRVMQFYEKSVLELLNTDMV